MVRIGDQLHLAVPALGSKVPIDLYRDQWFPDSAFERHHALAFEGGYTRPSSLRVFQRFRSNRLLSYLGVLRKCHNGPSFGEIGLDILSRPGSRDRRD